MGKPLVASSNGVTTGDDPSAGSALLAVLRAPGGELVCPAGKPR